LSAAGLDRQLGRVRELVDAYLAGGGDAFAAFAELVNLLLRVTVLKGTIGTRLTSGPRSAGGGPKDRIFVEGGFDVDRDIVPLNDGRFLRISITLFRQPHEGGHRLKVEHATYQYQVDEDGHHWAFRYDYERDPENEHPACHLQIRGNLYENELRLHRGLLERTHFPTGRVSLEAVLRLLIVQFQVPANTPADYWRPILAASEAAFERIAHRTLSGPSE
jgi:hypothetical protein